MKVRISFGVQSGRDWPASLSAKHGIDLGVMFIYVYLRDYSSSFTDVKYKDGNMNGGRKEQLRKTMGKDEFR